MHICVSFFLMLYTPWPPRRWLCSEVVCEQLKTQFNFVLKSLLVYIENSSPGGRVKNWFKRSLIVDPSIPSVQTWRQVVVFYIAGQSRQPSQVVCIPYDMKCWGAWETTLRAQSQGHHTIDHREEGGTGRNVGQSSSKRWTMAIINQTSTWNCFEGQ